jgi:hypothetical protein
MAMGVRKIDTKNTFVVCQVSYSWQQCNKGKRIKFSGNFQDDLRGFSGLWSSAESRKKFYAWDKPQTVPYSKKSLGILLYYQTTKLWPWEDKGKCKKQSIAASVRRR